MERYSHDQDGKPKHVTSLSYPELIESAKVVNSKDKQFQAQCASIQGRENFTGTKSLGEAIDLAEHGWQEGREKVDRVLKRVEAELGFLTLPSAIAPQFDVAGEEPDIDRFLGGDPENMVSFEPFQNKKIDFAINVGQHCFVDKKYIINRGVGILAAFNYLVANGYQCSVAMFDYSEGSSYGYKTEAHETYIDILSSNQFYDLDKLSFAITHSSFLRRLMFAQSELESPAIREAIGYYDYDGYGIPQNAFEDDLDSLPKENGQDEAVIIFNKDEGLVEEDELAAFSLSLIQAVKKKFEPDQALSRD